MIRCAATLVSLALLAGTAPADMLSLKDGRIIDGPKMEYDGDVLVVHFENGDVRVPKALIDTVAIEGQEFVPTTDEEKAQYAKGLVPYEGKWVKEAVRDKAMRKRLEEQREIIVDNLAHSEWGNRRENESKNFRWSYTIPEHIKEQFEKRCESYYTAFCKDWKVKRNNRKAKLMINFFSDAKEFYRTSGAGGGALAYFMFLGDYDLCVFYDRLDFEFTEMVLYHELSHYLQKLVNEEFKVPHWPGEGMAEFYGGALWDVKKKKLDVGLIQEGRLAQVKNDISLGNPLKLRDVVTKDAYSDYTWGWTLVHFLMNSEYRSGFQKYFKGIANAKGVNRSLGPFNLKTVTPEESLRYFMECLKIKDDEELKELEEQWYAYIDTELVLEGASGLEKAATGALNVGKRLRAKRLFQEAVDAGSTSAVMYHRYAQLIDGEDRKKAIRLYEKAVELDPVTGTYWFQMGKLVERDDEAEGLRMQALGKEMDPEVDAYDWDFGEFEAGSDDE